MAWWFVVIAGAQVLAINIYLIYLVRHATRGGAVRVLRAPTSLFFRHRAVLLPLVKILIFFVSFVVSNTIFFSSFFGRDSCFFSRTGERRPRLGCAVVHYEGKSYIGRRGRQVTDPARHALRTPWQASSATPCRGGCS